MGHLIRSCPWITIIIEGRLEGTARRERLKPPFMKQVTEYPGSAHIWMILRNQYESEKHGSRFLS